MNEALWYTGRGAGLVTLVLLTVVVVLGVASRAGRPLPGLPRFTTPVLHRNASLLAVVLLGVHVGSLLFDPYAQLRLVDLMLPFAGAHRPLWLGLGTLAFDLVVALVITSLLRSRLGATAWRRIHWAAYAAWPLAVLHGLGTGTDAGTAWLRAVTAVCVLTVAMAGAYRLLLPDPATGPLGPPAPPGNRDPRLTPLTISGPPR